MQNGISKPEKWNTIEFYFKIPPEVKESKFSLTADTKSNQDIFIKDVYIRSLTK